MPNMDPAHRMWELTGGPPHSKFNDHPGSFFYHLLLKAPYYDHEIPQGYRDNTKHIKGYVHSLDVGRIAWNHETGELQQIEVHDRYRRQGLGTALWNKAHELSAQHGLVAPVHSGVRTPDGTHWALSTKQPVPPIASGVCRDCSKLRDTNTGECNCGSYQHWRWY